MIIFDKKYHGTGLFSSSIFLSLGQGFEWGSDQVACVSANNRAVEIFANKRFIYESENSRDRDIIEKIAKERFGKNIEVLDGFILNGSVLESYPNVPIYEHARSSSFDSLFKPPFVRERCDRRLLFRRLDQNAKKDYERWLELVEK